MQVKMASGNIYIIADSDLIYDPATLQRSINLLNEYAWVVPYYFIYYLNKESTFNLLKTSPTWSLDLSVDGDLVNLARIGTTGGISIIPRKNFEEVGGFDNRFEGWGGGDNAFGYAIDTLCGPYKRMHSNIFHL